MSDITVEQLPGHLLTVARSSLTIPDERSAAYVTSVCEMAAAEIDRLRATLATMGTAPKNGTP